MQGYEVLVIDCRDHGISDGKHRGPSFGMINIVLNFKNN